MTVNNIFPLQNISDILNQFRQSSYFCTLDLTHGYYLAPLNPDDKEKRTFSMDIGHFQFTRLPQDVKGDPATFQHLMKIALSGLKGMKCFVYLNDVVIYGVSLKDHNHRLVDVLSHFRIF